MEIKWLGHSCFVLTSNAGFKMMMDSMDVSTGFSIQPHRVDVVTSSRTHSGHSCFAPAQEAPTRISEPGEYRVGEARIRGFNTGQGHACEKNIVFAVEMDDLRILHAGGLDHIPDADTAAAVGPVDVMFIPVGGIFTADPVAALELCALFDPNVVIPMHYKIAQRVPTLEDLNPFLLCAAKGRTVHQMRQSELTLTKASLGTNRIVVLQYDRAG